MDEMKRRYAASAYAHYKSIQWAANVLGVHRETLRILLGKRPKWSISKLQRLKQNTIAGKKQARRATDPAGHKLTNVIKPGW